MKQIFKPINIKLSVFSILLFTTLNLQAQIYPVTVTAILNPPYSVFLHDFFGQESKMLNASVVFNDLNETDRDIFFKIRIESNDIAIYSSPDYFSIQPFNVLSGSIYEFKGEDFEECLNYNNLNFSGINKNEFIQSGGRLPSGFYTISLEVYDSKSGKKISNTARTSAQIRLNSPPQIIIPQNGSVTQISENQNISIQWQPTIVYGNGNIDETEYSLSIYKIFDSSTDPDHAVVNKQVDKIFESNYSSLNSFVYNIDFPILETGKRYALIVHARDIYDRDIFENKGFSEQKWFYYGYPENGHIDIEYPENGKSFAIQDMPRFKWETPNNVLTVQAISYEFKIVKTDSLPAEQAIIANEPFYEKLSNPTSFHSGGQTTMPFLLDKQVEYAWQIKAYTGEQEVAKSDVYICYGPPLLEMFWAGPHKVYVTKTTTNDYNHLSGEGYIKISAKGDTANINFNDIKVENNGQWMLRSGSILYKLKNQRPITLIPNNTNINEECNLIPDYIRIARNPNTNAYELNIKGVVEWNFPHAIDSIQQGVIRTNSTWFNYDNYHVYGQAFLTNKNDFNLLEPLNHKIKLSTESNFTIYNNKYSAKMQGFVFLPSNIQGNMLGRIKIPFNETDNLYYIRVQQLELSNNIKLIDNTDFEIELTDVILDFSETQSPQRFSTNSSWKGAFFEKFMLIYNTDLDETGQLKMSEQKIYQYNLNTETDIKAWTTGEGLCFFIDKSLQNDGSFFNTFPSELQEIKMDIENSFLNEGYVKGNMFIPIISETEKYTFTIPITNEGLNIGYLDSDFTNFSFTMNPEGGDQQVDILIKTISFANQQRLEMTIDIGWPAIDVTMESIDGFCIWGDYSIGFYFPNSGRNLVTNVSGLLEQYEVTIESLGCGSSEGAYGFGVSGIVVISDEISGENGPPKINLYSVYPSVHAPFVDEGNFQPDSISISATIDNVNQEIALLEQTQAQINDLENSSGVIVDGVNSVIQNTNTTPSDNSYSEEDFQYQDTPEEEPENEDFSMERLIQILNGFSVFLPEEEQIKLQETINFLAVIPLPELQKIYTELKDVKSLSKKLAKAFVQNQLDKINTKINEAFARVTNQIKTKIDTSVLITTNFTDGVIDDAFDVIENKIIQLVSGSNLNPDSIIHTIIIISSNALKTEINDAVQNSVAQNVTIPINSFINNQIRDSITTFINVRIGEVAYQLIDNQSFELNLDFDQVLLGIGNNIKDSITSEKLINTVKNIGKDIIDSITFDGFISNILTDAKSQLLELAVSSLLQSNEYLADLNFMQNITANVQFDFSNIGDKLQNGDIDQIIKFDPTRIKIITKTIELEGFADYTKDDPVWGNCFKLDVIGKIKLNEETQIGAFLNFISGKTTQEAENYSYWYAGVGITDIVVPLTPTPFNMTGIEGALYRHMGLQGAEYMPDINTNFGINVEMHLNDISTKGEVIQLIVGTEFVFYDDYFTIQINGDIKAGNREGYSLITGDGYLNFSSSTGHIIGQFNVIANTAPIICAQGQMGVEIKGSNDWNVYIGKRETPVYIKLICKDNLALESWFDIGNTKLDLGIRANYQLSARSKWFRAAGRDWSLFAGIGFGFEASTIVLWNPFGINDALIEVSSWAEIGADWEKDNGDTGTFTLVSVSLYGMLNFATVPDPFIKGELAGHVEICNIGVDFDLEMDHDFI